MTRKDDRTPEQRKTHTLLVIGTDRVLSGWGKASGGASYAAWACTSDEYNRVLGWVESRSDMLRPRVAIDRPGQSYRPKCAHLHIYVVKPGHPALS